jgi:hypothetical protein
MKLLPCIDGFDECQNRPGPAEAGRYRQFWTRRQRRDGDTTHENRQAASAPDTSGGFRRQPEESGHGFAGTLRNSTGGSARRVNRAE